MSALAHSTELAQLGRVEESVIVSHRGSPDRLEKRSAFVKQGRWSTRKEKASAYLNEVTDQPRAAADLQILEPGFID